MRLIRNDKRCEYIIIDVTPEELAVVSAAVQIFGEDVNKRFANNFGKMKETIESVKNSFLDTNTIRV